VDIHSLPPRLHNRPARIPAEVERLATELLASHDAVGVAYADCGTYGGLDEVCQRLGLRRLRGLHCYDAIAGSGRVSQLVAEEPGTYLLTDFLVSGFGRLVVAELGLDRHPELRADYFGNYRRVVWLTERPTPALEQQAKAAALLMGLPLVIEHVGTERIEAELVTLIDQTARRRTGGKPASEVVSALS
jgi:hypothetical protein